MTIDWTKAASIRAALASGLSEEEMAADLSGEDAGVLETITQLTPVELVSLAKIGKRLTYAMLKAANALAKKKDFAGALRLHDSLIEIPAKDLPRTAGVQALLYVQNDEHKLGVMRERAQRYLQHYLPIGTANTPIFTNAVFVLIELGELDRAVEQLRLAKLAGDPDVDRWLSHDACAPLRPLPTFAAIAKLLPTYPRDLRWLQLQLSVHGDPVLEAQAQKIDLEGIADDLTPGTELYPALAASSFQVFAASGDGGELAFWEREPGQDILQQPVVIFGSDGTISVYADCLSAFFCLFAHGWSIAQAERVGFHFDSPTLSSSATKKTKTLKPQKTVLARLAKGGIDVGERDGNEALEAAIRLLPDLHAAARRVSQA